MAVMARLRAEVARRARYHCEYCGYPEAASSTPLEVDHIIPEARGGPTTFNNLALCCRRCNLHKHVQMEAVDPDTEVRAVAAHGPANVTIPRISMPTSGAGSHAFFSAHRSRLML